MMLPFILSFFYSHFGCPPKIQFKEERRQFGSCIQIELSEACLATPTFSIEISYATASGEAATGLQWLTAS